MNKIKVQYNLKSIISTIDILKTYIDILYRIVNEVFLIT